jgi:hypothetical protein
LTIRPQYQEQLEEDYSEINKVLEGSLENTNWKEVVFSDESTFQRFNNPTFV